MKAFLSITITLLTFLTLTPQVASAESSADAPGPTFGFSPVGVAVGDLSGLTGAIHFGWQINSDFAVQFDAEGIMSIEAGATSGDPDEMSSATNEDIAAVGTKWWPGNDTWTSASVGIGYLSRGQAADERGPALLVRAGHRLGQHTSLVVAARAVRYGVVSSAVGAGLEFEWGSPNR